MFLAAGNVFPCTIPIGDIKTNAVFGKVIAEFGTVRAPLPNATIEIFKKKKDREEIIAVTKSDENGRFEIKNIPAGKYTISAYSEHFRHSYAWLNLKNTSRKKRDQEIVFTLVTWLECSGDVRVQKILETK